MVKGDIRIKVAKQINVKKILNKICYCLMFFKRICYCLIVFPFSLNFLGLFQKIINYTNMLESKSYS